MYWKRAEKRESSRKREERNIGKGEGNRKIEGAT